MRPRANLAMLMSLMTATGNSDLFRLQSRQEPLSPPQKSEEDVARELAKIAKAEAKRARRAAKRAELEQP